MKNFFEDFVDLMETYVEEEITKKAEYKELLHKCAVLSEKKEKHEEYKNTCDRLDWLYRRCLVECVIKCMARFMVDLGMV